MIIRNFEDLATTEKRRDCLEILESGLQAAEPESIMNEFVIPGQIRIDNNTWDISKYSSVYSVAFGKAADTMTRTLNSIIPVKSGIIVIPKGSKSRMKSKKFQIFNSSHPKPDQTSVKAAKEVMKFVENKRSGELIIFLVSGGASSLVALPNGITLEDKAHTTDVLLKSGADIAELNCVRKHLSKIKGGRLVENMKCDGLGLVMSDVQGDDLSSIASGITHMDDTTYQDALNVIDRYDLKRKMPPEVLNVLQDGADKKIPETLKNVRIKNFVIANNENCLQAMQKKATSLGHTIDIINIFGDVKGVVTILLEKMSHSEKSCIIFGGEPTVKVLGKGMGGRNQELVLRLLKNTQKLEKMVIASMGTDGIDGNSVFAGAITENAKTAPDTIKEFLKNSDSGRFFQKQKANIITDFTHTNLMDIGVILR